MSSLKPMSKILPFYFVARKRKIFTRWRVIAGSIAIVFLVAVVLSGGQNLNLANPYTGGLDFRTKELHYGLFSLADVPKLTTLVQGTEAEILNKQCYMKLHASAELENGQLIPLDSEFQTFQTLFPFSLTSAQGGDIVKFRNIELRLRCDPILKKDGTLYEWEVIPRPLSPFTLYVDGYNQQGKLVQLAGGSYKPTYEFDGIAYTVYSQYAINVNPDKTIVFGNKPTLSNPLDPNKGTYPTSEQTISKGVKVEASDLENAIESSTTLPKKTFTSEIQFKMTGSFDINFPELKNQGISFPNQIPIDQGIVIAKMDIIVTEPTSSGISIFPSKKITITKLEPVSTAGEFTTDFSADFKPFRAYVTVDAYDSTKDGRVPTGKIYKQVGSFAEFSPERNVAVATTGFGCSSSSVDQFICQFNLQNNLPVGDYIVRIETLDSNRVDATKSFIIVRDGAPVGQDNGCADGFVPSSVPFYCVRYGSTGTGQLGTTCLTGQIKDVNTGECITPSGGTGGGVQDPCPVQGQERNPLGICVETKGTGGANTRACTNCKMDVIRVVALTDVCPKFDCGEGKFTPPEGIPNCDDKKPSTLVNGQYTCDRLLGIIGDFFSKITGFLGWLPYIIVGIIILIIIIAIISAIAKSSPAGRAIGAIPRGY